MADITDATFEADVIERSKTVPVVVDLWAEWCGPCKTLGPILDKVIGETQGLVELAKIDVDANPAVAQAFQVQSIPAVYAMYNGTVVDGFMGAKGEAEVVEFVQGLLNMTAGGAAPVDDADGETDASASAAATESAVAPAEPEAGEVRPEAAAAQAAPAAAIRPDAVISAPPGEAVPAPVVAPSAAEAEAIEVELKDLLARVKGDDDARARYVELLDQLGAADPRTNDYRRKLASALF